MEGDWTKVVTVCVYSFLITCWQCTEGNIMCACTTSDCQRDQERSCTAKNMCYVQYMPPIPLNNPHVPAVVRGCIDDLTPLLCENRRPKAYQGSWPVLLCCRDGDWCNRDVMPTNPPWVVAVFNEPKPTLGDNPETSSEHLEYLDYYDDDDYYNFGKDDDPMKKKDEENDYEAPSESSRTLNPLYIGVPAAGACVLLAIIIFAIYILKRHNQYLEEYHKRIINQQKLPPRPSNSGKPGLVACNRNCLYAESDQSSNASDSRLLPVMMKA